MQTNFGLFKVFSSCFYYYSQFYIMNSVIFLLKNDFSPLSFEDKVKIKELGRPIPYLDIKKKRKKQK